MPEAQAAIKDLSCEQCRELLSEYVDREIAEDARAAIEQHLNTCTRCTTESTRIQGLKNIVRHWDGVSGSGEFRKVVMQRMISESQQVPSGQFNQAADSARSNAASVIEDEAQNGKSLPPIWVLAAAVVMAVIVYYVILKIRGM